MQTSTLWRALAVSILTITVAACGGGGSSPVAVGGGGSQPTNSTPTVADDPAPTLELGTTTTIAGLTNIPSYGVTVLNGSDTQVVNPNAANIWDLTSNFSLIDGKDDQWDGAMELSIAIGNQAVRFPSDQDYSELSFHDPSFASTAAIPAAAVWTPNGGGRGASLAPSVDTRLQQTLTLPDASGGAITVTWTGNEASLSTSMVCTTRCEPRAQRVMLRNTAGAALATLYESGYDSAPLTTTGTWAPAAGVDISAFAGQTVVLSFEQKGGVTRFISPMHITTVSVSQGATQIGSNMDFSADLTNWVATAAATPSGVASGARLLTTTVATISAKRHFYTQPGAEWGRWVDMLTNTSSATATMTVTYDHNLGSDTRGNLSYVPGSGNRALAEWDGSGINTTSCDRDTGIVWGSGATSTFVTSTVFPSPGGGASNVFSHSYQVSLAPGQTKSLVNFIILTGQTTCAKAGTTLASRPVEVDSRALDILNNFNSSVVYRRGMTQQQLSTVENF